MSESSNASSSNSTNLMEEQFNGLDRYINKQKTVNIISTKRIKNNE